MASAAGPRRGWRLLGLFWAVLLTVVGAGAGVLFWLGPTEPAASAAAEPPVAPPRMAASPAAPAVPPAAPAAPLTELPAPAGLAGQSIPPPDPALLEPGPHGPLPRLGADGRTAIRTYGRPFDRTDTRPRIGLVLGGIGLNAAIADEAMRRLPPTVALAFSPYAPRLAPLLEQARGGGIETLVALPLEPTNYPLDSPGTRVLLTGVPPHENSDRLEWALSRFQGYVGAIGALGPLRGERFAALPDRLGALQDVLRARGLLYVDPRPAAPPPARAWGRSVDLILDEPATRAEIDTKLATLERLARERGTAVGYGGEASPVLIDRIAGWAAGVEGRGLALAPISALIRRPAEPQQVAR